MASELVVRGSLLSLGVFAEFNRLQVKFRNETKQLSSLNESLGRITEHYLSQYPDMVLELERWKSRVRSVEKGAPRLEVDASVLELSKSLMRSELTSAEHMLLKRAYRRAASVFHPDKGGSVELMLELTKFYELGDAAGIMHMYSLYTKDWQYMVNDGLQYLKDVQGYPQAKLQLLRQSRLYTKLALPHMFGRRDEAHANAKLLLEAMIREESKLFFNLNQKEGNHAITTPNSQTGTESGSTTSSKASPESGSTGKESAAC